MPWVQSKPYTVEEIREWILEGLTYAAIAKKLDLTPQRIQQIAAQHKLPNPREVRQQEKQERYFAKWGKREDTEIYHACRQKYRAKKANAQKAGHEWSITFGEIEFPEKCPILGIDLDYFAEARTEESPSFDRCDPSQGYVPGNVKIISWRANRIKNDGTAEEHQLIVDYLIKHG